MVVSRFLSPAEKNYAVIELELLAIQWATEKCRLYLAGADFTIVTDHQPLLSVLNRKNLDAINNVRIQRLMSKLLGYSFKVKWIPGKKPRNRWRFVTEPGLCRTESQRCHRMQNFCGHRRHGPGQTLKYCIWGQGLPGSCQYSFGQEIWRKVAYNTKLTPPGTSIQCPMGWNVDQQNISYVPRTNDRPSGRTPKSAV